MIIIQAEWKQESCVWLSNDRLVVCSVSWAVLVHGPLQRRTSYACSRSCSQHQHTTVSVTYWLFMWWLTWNKSYCRHLEKAVSFVVCNAVIRSCALTVRSCQRLLYFTSPVNPVTLYLKNNARLSVFSCQMREVDWWLESLVQSEDLP